VQVWRLVSRSGDAAGPLPALGLCLSGRDVTAAWQLGSERIEGQSTRRFWLLQSVRFASLPRNCCTGGWH